MSRSAVVVHRPVILLLGSHVGNQVTDAVAVAPLIVIPEEQRKDN